jgi:hypothetical protein
VVLYVASDNAASALQINSTASWPAAVVPLTACHVDHARHTHSTREQCAVNTFVQWFMLSLSDAVVLQSLLHVDKPEFSIYSEYSAATREAEATFAAVEPGGPISAFSRFAAIYGLHRDSMVYGLTCRAANRTALSWQTRGNWMCDNKLFY